MMAKRESHAQVSNTMPPLPGSYCPLVFAVNMPLLWSCALEAA